MFGKIFQKIILEIPENLRVRQALRTIRSMGDEACPDTYDIIVFSKDRPLQLSALIDSYAYYCDNPIKLNIIYSASSPEYQHAYDSLLKEYESKISTAQNDKNGFKACLLEILEGLEGHKVFFLVDDIIFKKKINLVRFMTLGRGYIPSLRMGLHLARSYTQSKMQSIPKLNKVDSQLYTWNYFEGELDWGYPLSVDGHIFYRDEIILMTRAIEFKAPNSYEAKLQKFNKVFKKRVGVCMETSAILNIPCNKVQIENENIFGSFHQDELLKIFNEKKIDFKSYENFENESCHQEVALNLIAKVGC